MNKNIIIVIVLSMLIVISVVQTFQLSNLKTDVASGTLSTGSVSKSTSILTGTDSNAQDSTNLPEMVGGC